MSVKPKTREDIPEMETPIIPVEVILRKFYEQGVYLLEHGTYSAEQAGAILRDGLRLHEPDLSSTTFKVLGPEAPLEDWEYAFLEHGMKGGFDHTKYKVLVVVPPSEVKENTTGTRYDSIIEKTEDTWPDPRGLNREFPYIVPKRYLAGYVDCNSRLFYPNPSMELTGSGHQ